jgi:hypothetical protein
MPQINHMFIYFNGVHEIASLCSQIKNKIAQIISFANKSEQSEQSVDFLIT